MDGMMVSSSEPPQERTLFGSTSFKLDKSNNAEESDLFGSGSFKHDRSSNAEENEDDGHQWRFSKVSKTDSLPRNSVYSHGEGQMLSFASANTHNPSHSYYYTPSNHHPYFRNEGGMNVNMQDAMGRARGPFTPSQWMELEHQALLYKYIAANVPIPQSLLLPLRRSLLSSPHFPPPFSSGYFSGYPLGGMGGYSLTSGVGGDAEPGRCRRTDGKKWRCSRDAVPDQKYCERHINRGRHRSRKHVEPQTQPRLSSSVTNKPTPATSSSPADVAARSALQRTSPSLYREEDNLSLLSPMLPFSSKNQSNGLSESSEFGTHTNLHHFMDETGTDQSYHRYQSWPELQDERTQLSISIPSLGGPLGEVLNKNCGAHDDAKEQGIKGGLNLLMGSGWDLDSDPQPEASPTGVLQKTGFGSLSSSAGSSPRLESYKAHDDLGSILVNHLSNLSSV